MFIDDSVRELIIEGVFPTEETIEKKFLVSSKYQNFFFKMVCTQNKLPAYVVYMFI